MMLISEASYWDTTRLASLVKSSRKLPATSTYRRFIGPGEINANQMRFIYLVNVPGTIKGLSLEGFGNSLKVEGIWSKSGYVMPKAFGNVILMTVFNASVLQKEIKICLKHKDGRKSTVVAYLKNDKYLASIEKMLTRRIM